MKPKLLTTLLSIVIASVSAPITSSAYSPTHQGSFVTMSQFDQFEKIEVSPDCYYLCPPMATEPTRTEEDEDLYIVDVNVTLHGNEMLLFFSYALSPQGEYYAAYKGKQTSVNTMTFLVPEGSYDLCVFVGEMGSQGTETILGGNIDVTSDMTLEYDTDEATLKTTIEIYDPYGTLIMREMNGEPGNCPSGMSVHIFNYEDYTYPLIISGNMGYKESYIHYRTMPGMDYITLGACDSRVCEAGLLYTEMTVDPTKEFNRTIGDNWIIYEGNIAPTPFSERYEALSETDPQINMYTNSVGQTMVEDYVADGATVGWLDIPNKICSWAPSDHDGKYRFLSSYVSQGWNTDYGIQSMLMNRTENGFEFSGNNFIRTFVRTADGPILPEGNPRLIMPVTDDLIIGNSSPNALFTNDKSQWGCSFDYRFIGRYGEIRNIDAQDLADTFSEDLIELLGGPTHTLEVYADGELICSSYSDTYYMDWMPYLDSKMKVDIVDNNILVDGIRGKNHTEVVYDQSKEDFMAPTMTQLQIRNAEDVVTDHLSSQEDGFIEFFAADFSWVQGSRIWCNLFTEYYDYLEAHPIHEVKVEYAPFEQDDFEELTVREIPELFFMPGYGYCFRAYPDTIDKGSANGWYDLRFTLTDAAGNYQTQTISPAFHLDTLSGVDSPYMQDVATGWEVWTVDGKLVKKTDSVEATEGLPGGVYIIKNPKEAKKIIVR